ncbi:MAG: hypothetical protein PHQ11_17110 [Paludibacter sp.]|nr:hypothetical protein [Paludibacter sp.]
MEECMQYMHKNNIRHIALTPLPYGCMERDISFLECICDKIEGLNVQDERYDYAIINKFHNLKELKIEDNKRDCIDFLNFPDLESCTGIELSKRFINLESCKKLRALSIQKYRSSDGNLKALPNIPALEHLGIVYANIVNLCGIERFSYLKAISLYRAHKLESLDDLISLSDVLEEFELEGKTKIFNYHALGKLRVIKRLFLCNVGDIKDLSFLETLPSLNHFVFMDSNVVDGDLSYCKKVNGWVAFTNKKHYSMTFEELHPEWVAEQRKRSKELDEKMALKEQDCTSD